MSGAPRPKPTRRPKTQRGWNSTLGRRSGRLNQQSEKRRAEERDRAEVRRVVRARAGGRCEARDLVPEVRCWGPLDVDEVEARGVHPGAHLDPDLCQLLCRGHHDWRHANPAEAEARGLRRRSTYDQGDPR